MADPDEIFRCRRCRMGYRVSEPDPRADRLVCPECRLRHWCMGRAGNIVTVGIDPVDTSTT